MSLDTVRRGPTLERLGATGEGRRRAEHPVAGYLHPPRQGLGFSYGHHGEIIQGRIDVAGEPTDVLVTLPYTDIGSRAVFSLSDESHLTVVDGEGKRYGKTLEAARLTLNYLGLPDAGGQISIATTIPRGHGLGSSTADVLAVIRAVGDAVGVSIPPVVQARLAVEAEKASDALMWDEPVLFAQTKGIALRHFDRPLPRFRVVGTHIEASDGIDTLTFNRPAPSRQGRDEFGVIVAGFSRALHEQSPELLGMAATASTRLDYNHRPRENLKRVLSSFEAWGALGVQVAHSGTTVGLILRENENPEQQKAIEDDIALRLEDVCQNESWRLSVGQN